MKLLSITLGMGLALPAPGQTIPQAAPLTAQPAGSWSVDYADWQCVLNRKMMVGGKPALFSLSMEPITTTAWMRLAIEGAGGGRDDGDAVMFADGERVPGVLHFNIYDVATFRMREYMLDLKRHPIATLKSGLRYWTAKHGDVQMQLGGFQPAWRALHACMQDLHAKFGVTPEDIARVVTPPEGSTMDATGSPPALRAADYSFLYWVTPQGRVDACTLVRPSGQSGFDGQLCKRLIARGRFKPARDAQGRPVRAPQYEAVSYRIVVQSS